MAPILSEYHASNDVSHSHEKLNIHQSSCKFIKLQVILVIYSIIKGKVIFTQQQFISYRADVLPSGSKACLQYTRLPAKH